MERAELERALAEAAAGRPSIRVVTGEAGIGKTALVEAVLEHDARFRQLWARGVEDEGPLPYAALHALLRPVLERVDDLPAPQAEALAGALALRAAEPVDRFGVGAATLTLLASIASEQPLVVVLDDAQWVDAASWQALRFAIRRLEAEPVCVLVTWRDEEPLPREVDQLPQLHQLHLAGLPAEEVPALLAPRRVATPVAAALHEATGGNPLALRELGRALDDDHLLGQRPLPDPLPAGRDLLATYGRRVADLPAPTQQVALVLAAGGRLTAGELLSATRALGLRDDAVTAAERAGLVTHDRGRVDLAHPLLRAAVYWATDPAARRAAHGALATAVGDPARAIAHRAAAALGPDDAVAGELVAVGEDATRRGDLVTAARAFERAAELSGDQRAAARLLVRAGGAALEAGAHRSATDLLRRAAAGPLDPADEASCAELQARNETWAGDVDRARSILEAAADRAAPRSPGDAARLLSQAVMPTLASGDVRGAAALRERVQALAGDAPELAAPLELLMLPAGVCGGEPAHELLALLREPASLLTGDGGPAELVALVALPLMWLERYDDADRLLRAALARARRGNHPASAPLVLSTLAELGLRTGDLIAAQAHAAEAVRLAEAVGRQNEAVLGHVAAARLAAMRGDAALVDEHVEAATPIVEASNQASTQASLDAIRGLLALGGGRIEEAVVHLTAVERRTTAHGLAHPNVVPWRADFVEALVRAGRREEAQRQADLLTSEAMATGSRWAAAAAARCRVLLSDGVGVRAAARDAEARLDQVEQPFEEARTLLVAGEQLRRHQHRREGRLLLGRAAEAFARLGTTVWLDRAEAERGATAPRRRAAPRAFGALDSLTPQELQVALAVAEGGTNREVAAALFLSPKTIESHLGRVFRKLGVRTRSELTARVLKEWEGRGRR